MTTRSRSLGHVHYVTSTRPCPQGHVHQGDQKPFSREFSLSVFFPVPLSSQLNCSFPVQLCNNIYTKAFSAFEKKIKDLWNPVDFSDTKFPIDLVQVHISNTFQHYNVTKYSKIILKNAEHQYTTIQSMRKPKIDTLIINTTKLYWFHWLLTFDMCLFTFYIWHLLFAIWHLTDICLFTFYI